MTTRAQHPDSSPTRYLLAEFVADCESRGADPLDVWADIRVTMDARMNLWVIGPYGASDDDADYFNFELHEYLSACWECKVRAPGAVEFVEGLPYCHEHNQGARDEFGANDPEGYLDAYGVEYGEED